MISNNKGNRNSDQFIDIHGDTNIKLFQIIDTLLGRRLNALSKGRPRSEKYMVAVTIYLLDIFLKRQNDLKGRNNIMGVSLNVFS